MTLYLVMGSAAVALVAVAVWSYLRWFLGRATQGAPTVRVETVREAPGRIRAELMLVASPGPARMTRLLPPGPALPGADELIPPPGFEEVYEGAARVWMPVRPITLFPGEVVNLPLLVPPGLDPEVTLTGHVEYTVGPGGGGIVFSVPVGPRSEERVQLENLRSRVRAEAWERGILPRDHPDWSRLKLLERELGEH